MVSGFLALVGTAGGAPADGKKVDVGAELVKGLEQSSAVTSKLKLQTTTLTQAKATMDRAGAYATLVIPATLSRSALLSAGAGGHDAGLPPTAQVELLETTRPSVCRRSTSRCWRSWPGSCPRR